MDGRTARATVFLETLAPELVELHGLTAVTYAPRTASRASLESSAAELLIAVVAFESDAAGWERVVRAYEAHRTTWAVAAADIAHQLAADSARHGKAAGR